MKKSHSPIYLLLACLLLTSLLGPAFFTPLTPTAKADDATVNAGPPSGGGGRGGRAKRKPTAQLRAFGSDSVITPITLTSGVAMTYTVSLLNEKGTAGDMTARTATFELPWNGNQTFVDFSSTNTSWTLKSHDATGVIVDLGDVKVGDRGTITIHATFATNYNKAIFRQTMYLNWNDDNYARRVGINLTYPVTFATTAPVTVPTVTVTPPAGPPTSGPFAPVAALTNTDTLWYFPATKHALGGQFLNYWMAHGSVTNLGYPISEEFQDNGHTIQYFERVVMEFWPDNPDPYKVLLRSLGNELNGVDPGISADTPPATDGSVFYTETGHWLDGRFVDTWEAMGGLAQFGFPITEPVMEGDKLVQWTERARFEIDLSRPDQLVMLGLVGDEAAKANGYLP